MILNRIEFLLMNNPIRRVLQDKVEARELRRLSSLPKNKIILEIGCGNGSGTRLIKKYFYPKEIYAIDLDPRMIKLAKEKNIASTHFQVASATNLPFENNFFDAVVDFGIIHHIPNWKKAIQEVHRVLKPAGELICEDLSIESFSGFPGSFYRKILDHPYKQMYFEQQFLEGAREVGFAILQFKKKKPACLLQYFVLIARKKK